MPEEAGEPSTGFLGALGTFRNQFMHDHQISTREPILKLSMHEKSDLLAASCFCFFKKAKLLKAARYGKQRGGCAIEPPSYCEVRKNRGLHPLYGGCFLWAHWDYQSLNQALGSPMSDTYGCVHREGQQ